MPRTTVGRIKTKHTNATCDRHKVCEASGTTPGAPLPLTRTNDKKLVLPLPSCALVDPVCPLVGRFAAADGWRNRTAECADAVTSAHRSAARTTTLPICCFFAVRLSRLLSLFLCVCVCVLYAIIIIIITLGEVVYYYIIELPFGVRVSFAAAAERKKPREGVDVRRGAPRWVGKYLSGTCRIVAARRRLII